MKRKGIKPVVYEDTSFVVGESPRTLDVNADLGLNSGCGYLKCDGSGNILVAFSTDGSTFSDSITVKSGEEVILDDLDIDSIKLTHSADSSYRIMVW